jgi:hypothetical protein
VPRTSGRQKNGQKQEIEERRSRKTQTDAERKETQTQGKKTGIIAPKAP